MRRTTKFVFLS